MDRDHNDPDEMKQFEEFAAEAREYAASKNRARVSESRNVSTRSDRPRPDRPDNPLKAHDRHQQDHGPDQEKRLHIIADPARRNEVHTQVAKHYSTWGKALYRAHNRRYDDSERIYARKIAEQKIDERLIPPEKKDTLRKDAIREAVAQSKNRIEDINTSMPRMIDRAIDTAVKLTPRSRQTAPLDNRAKQAKDALAQYKARERQISHDRGDRER
jgi:hypothetical protein